MRFQLMIDPCCFMCSSLSCQLLICELVYKHCLSISHMNMYICLIILTLLMNVILCIRKSCNMNGMHIMLMSQLISYVHCDALIYRLNLHTRIEFPYSNVHIYENTYN